LVPTMPFVRKMYMMIFRRISSTSSGHGMVNNAYSLNFI
jgi:hypothetical protein